MSTIPYVPAYLRATPPTIWPVTSPLDFGAIGNGSTDDYPAITAALHALVAKGGGTLVFPNDRDFRIATPGVHGIHLAGQSNITIMMGERSRLIMDNMVDGLAVSHGIFVEGPCENIALIGVHVKFAAMSVSRQTWAPIYFLGANVGTGDQATGGWYRGNPSGSEDWPQIAAGAISNVRLENVTAENSPSVGFGLIGIDGVEGNNLTVKTTWADGIYLRYHRLARIDGYYGLDVGDDGISFGTEDSDLDAADIELPFHGEFSVLSNIVLEGQYRSPIDGYRPASGGIVPLGVRDTVVTGVVVSDRFRGIRLEPGTQRSLDYPLLNINFLANRRVVIDGVTLTRCVQDIASWGKECNLGTPDKWWRHDMTIANVVGEGGSSSFDFGTLGIPQNGGPSMTLVAGITFRNLKFTRYSSPYTTLAGVIDGTFDGVETDSPISIQGHVPYGVDPDMLDGDGNPMWPDNLSTFRNISGQSVNFQGLKRCTLENITSTNAANVGISISTCADIRVDGVRVVYPNRFNDALNNSAVSIDEYCKRIVGDNFDIEQDGNAVGSIGLLNAERHRIGTVRVKTTQDLSDPFLALQSDRSWIDSKVSQIDRIEWFHSGSDQGWGVRQFPLLPVPELAGDSDQDLFVANQGSRHRIIYPLSANRTWIMHDGGAAVGDRIEVTRLSETGGYSVTFQGQGAAVAAFPVSDAKTIVKVAGSAGGQITSLLVDGTTELLGSHVLWASSNAATALAIAAAINARTGTTGFTANTFDDQLTILAPAASYETYNNAQIEQTTTGDLLLSVGAIPAMKGGADSDSAGEATATSNFLLVGDDHTDFAGGVSSVTVNGTELLAAPVTWDQTNDYRQTSNYTAVLVAKAIMDNHLAHGFFANASKNAIFIEAPKGYGASANGWVVAVTTTGAAETYDVKPMTGGRDPPVPSDTPDPYAILTTTPGEAFTALFEYSADGWKLVSIAYQRVTYPNGVPIMDSAGRLYDQAGTAIADEYMNRKYANGATLGYDSGMLAMGLSAPPASSSAFGNAGMTTYDASYLYVCIATNSWKRIALSSF